MKILLLAVLFLAACATAPKLPPVGVQCFVKRGNILMKVEEPRLYPSDKIIALSMKDYDACMVIKLSPIFTR